MKRIHIFCLLLLLAGCKVGPDYKDPAANLPEGWKSGAVSAQAQTEQDWWKHFHDPVLNQLIAKALSGNWDLKIAEARIAQARAARSTARNDLLPTVNTDASFERQGNRLAFPGGPGFDLAKPFDTYQVGFDASWELDLFGGKRRGLEAATADLETAKAQGDDARISLLAEVARTYVDIRQYQAQTIITQDSLNAYQQTAKIARERFKVGEVAGFDVAQADAQVRQARAQLPYYQNMLLQAEFSMDVLLAEKPGATQSLITSEGPIPMGDDALVLAAPAKVIANRPDIRAAEQKLASATASQGVAVAQFFPDISLTGFFGLLTTQGGELLKGDNKSWDVGGNVLWPILNYGKLSANLHAADAHQQEALATYQKAIVSALSDVERAVTAYTKEHAHTTALNEAAGYELHTVNIARKRYREGLSSFLEVLDTERTLYAAQSQAAASSALTAQDLIAVYKSLGGGWKDTAPKTPDQSAKKEPVHL